MEAWYINSSLACAAWLSYFDAAQRQESQKTPQLILPAVREADLRMEQSLPFLLQNSHLLSVTRCYGLVYGASSGEPHAATKGARRLGDLARMYFEKPLPMLLFAPSLRTRPAACYEFCKVAKSPPKKLLRLWWTKRDCFCFDHWVVPYRKGRYGVQCLSLPSFFHCGL